MENPLIGVFARSIFFTFLKHQTFLSPLHVCFSGKKNTPISRVHPCRDWQRAADPLLWTRPSASPVRMQGPTEREPGTFEAFGTSNGHFPLKTLRHVLGIGWQFLKSLVKCPEFDENELKSLCKFQQNLSLKKKTAPDKYNKINQKNLQKIVLPSPVIKNDVTNCTSNESKAALQLGALAVKRSGAERSNWSKFKSTPWQFDGWKFEKSPFFVRKKGLVFIWTSCRYFVVVNYR